MPFDAACAGEPSYLSLLLQAREIIADPKHWLQRAYYRKSSYTGRKQYCAMAALAVACDNPSYSRPTLREKQLARLLVDEMPLGRTLWRLLPAAMRVRCYNDAPKTIHHDVLGLFDRAISRLLAGRCESVAPALSLPLEPAFAGVDAPLECNLNGSPDHSPSCTA